jgi:carbon monoxide dehydrogenase subunit G
MDVEGTYTLQAVPEVVWRSLADRQKLVSALPGLEQLEQIDSGGQSYLLTIHLKHSLLRGVYTSKITLVEKQFPYYCRILIESDKQPNTLSGSGTIYLKQRDQATVIAYQGSLQVGKAGTRLPLALTRGAAKLVLQRLLNGLASQLPVEMTVSTPSSNEQGELSADGVWQPAGSIAISSPATSSHTAPAQSQVFTLAAQKLVRWLHLGADDIEQQALWVTRVRRIGIATALLFLVWVGTRLPRR